MRLLEVLAQPASSAEEGQVKTARKQSRRKVAEDLLPSKGVVEWLSLEDTALLLIPTLPAGMGSCKAALNQGQISSGEANSWASPGAPSPGTSPFVLPHLGSVWLAPRYILMYGI